MLILTVALNNLSFGLIQKQDKTSGGARGYEGYLNMLAEQVGVHGGGVKGVAVGSALCAIVHISFPDVPMRVPELACMCGFFT